MKKILVTAFVLCALMFALTSCIPGEPEFTFELRDADSYMVSIADANGAKVITIPDTYAGKPVTAIKQSGFANIESLENVVVPDSIDFIGTRAFENCINLEEIILGKSVEKLSGTLQVYVEPETPTVNPGDITVMYPTINFTPIGSGESLEIEYVTGTFSPIIQGDFTLDLTTQPIVLGGGSGVFSNCVSLEYISVSADNEHYKSVDGSLYTKDGTVLVRYAQGKNEKHLIIPDGVVKFDSGAFGICNSVEKLTLPDSILAYEDNANYYLYAALGMGVDGIYFSGFPYLKEIVVKGSNPNYKVIDGNLYTKDGSVLVQYAVGKKDKSFTIPDGVKSVDSSAFANVWGEYNLKVITVSGSVESMSYPAGITLTEMKVAENNATYKSVDGVMYSKDGKTLIYYPMSKSGNSYTTIAGTETIATGAFMNVENLKTLIIGDSVKTLEEHSIISCPALEKISLGNGVTSVEGGSYYYISDSDGSVWGNAKLKLNEYEGAYYLGNDSNPYVLLVKAKDTGSGNCTVHDKTKIIYGGAFAECSMLRITISESISGHTLDFSDSILIDFSHHHSSDFSVQATLLL